MASLDLSNSLVHFPPLSVCLFVLLISILDLSVSLFSGIIVVGLWIPINGNGQ